MRVYMEMCNVRCAVCGVAFRFRIQLRIRPKTQRLHTHTHARSKHEGFTSSSCTKGNSQTATMSTAVTRKGKISEAFEQESGLLLSLACLQYGRDAHPKTLSCSKTHSEPAAAAANLNCAPNPSGGMSAVHSHRHTHDRLIWDPTLASFLSQQA